MKKHLTHDKMKEWPVIGPLVEKSRPRVAVIRLSGVIGESSGRRGGICLSRYERILDRAFEVFNLKGVALSVNSPGGAPGQTELIAGRIRQLADEKKLPVYAFVEDVAASGGYWLACTADKIYALETSLVGSIGVIYAGFGLQDLIQRYGVERRVHTSGDEKSFMDPFLPEKPGDVERLTHMQRDMHRSFKEWIRERRGSRLHGEDSDLFEGQIWTGQQALSQGLIDGLGDARSTLRSVYGRDVKLVPLAPEKGLMAALTGGAKILTSAKDPVGHVQDSLVWQRYGL